MKTKSIIDKCFALMLLLVFITGRAPRAFLHDLISNHTDIPGCTIDHDTTVFHPHATNCDFDEHVVPVSFVFEKGFSVFLPLIFVDKTLSSSTCFYFSALLQHKENRGPPSV